MFKDVLLKNNNDPLSTLIVPYVSQLIAKYNKREVTLSEGGWDGRGGAQTSRVSGTCDFNW